MTLSPSDVKVVREALEAFSPLTKPTPEAYAMRVTALKLLNAQEAAQPVATDCPHGYEEKISCTQCGLIAIGEAEPEQPEGWGLHQGREKAVFDWFADNGLAPPLHSDISDLLAAVDAVQPQGDFVMVPREPTEAMLEAAYSALGDYVKERRKLNQPLVEGDHPYRYTFKGQEKHAIRYRAMLAAAPQPESAGDARELFDLIANQCPNKDNCFGANIYSTIESFSSRIRAEALERAARLCEENFLLGDLDGDTQYDKGYTCARLDAAKRIRNLKEPT